jgi:hypothetical protein
LSLGYRTDLFGELARVFGIRHDALVSFGSSQTQHIKRAGFQHAHEGKPNPDLDDKSVETNKFHFDPLS